MRISILPCLTSVLFFHVPDYFRILVYTALFHLTCMHAYYFLVGLRCMSLCVCVRGREVQQTWHIYMYESVCVHCSSVFWVQFPAPPSRTYFLWQKRRCLYTQFYIQSDPPAQLWHSSSALQARRCTVPVWRSHWRLGDKWQLYLCVLHESIKHWPFKMLPGYLKLSATSSWDQIGMLLRQSRTTHPLVSLVMCVTACVGEYHVLFNYKCTPSTVVDVLEIGRLQVQFEVCLWMFLQLFLEKHRVLMQPVRPCALGYLRTPTASQLQACTNSSS